MHLRQSIKPQNYNLYSPIDQVLCHAQNIHFLKNVAHDSYLQGLKETSIDVDQIPNMYGMNRTLKKIGWAAQ